MLNETDSSRKKKQRANQTAGMQCKMKEEKKIKNLHRDCAISTTTARSHSREYRTKQIKGKNKQTVDEVAGMQSKMKEKKNKKTRGMQ
jgi:hypothetical protein